MTINRSAFLTLPRQQLFIGVEDDEAVFSLDTDGDAPSRMP